MPDDPGTPHSAADVQRRQQPGFPFWVIRGAGRAANSQPAPPSPSIARAGAAAGAAIDQPFAQTLAASRGAGGRPVRTDRRPSTTRAGRTGVDIRAGAPSASRPVVRAPRSARRFALPWKRPTQPPSRRPSTERASRDGHRGRRTIVALIALIVVQALFLAAIAWGLTSPTFQARYVQVQGTSDPALLATIQRLPLTGCNIFRCDLTRRAHLIEALPAVAHAEVHTIYPNGLFVVVTPRRPALLWQTNGQALVIASDGTVLGPLASDPTYTKLALLPISDPSAAAFSGRIPQPGYQIPATEAEMAGQLRTGITRMLGSGWTLQWTADRGFVASNPSGIQILFGTPTDAAQTLSSYPGPAALAATPTPADVDRGVAAQLQILQALRSQLAQSGQQASLIDLRWGPHPYYRLANGA